MTKIKRRSVRKSVRKSMRKMRIKGGGCGCNKSASLFSGGNAIPVYWSGGGVLPVVTPTANRSDIEVEMLVLVSSVELHIKNLKLF